MHDGHRERLKERFAKEDLDSFDAHNVLELILFYAIPRKDTNLIAHRLINTFGSISAVFDASIGDLIKVDGMGKNAATYLKLFPSVMRKYREDKDRDFTIIQDSEMAGKYLLPSFLGRSDEVVVLVCLDSKRKVLANLVIFEGSVNSAQISVRKIVEAALRYNSSSVLIAHNHPGGLALPSKEDVATTSMVKNILAGVGIDLLDHIVVADGDFVSFADSGLLKD